MIDNRELGRIQQQKRADLGLEADGQALAVAPVPVEVPCALCGEPITIQPVLGWTRPGNIAHSECLAAVRANTTRMFFVTREMADRVLDACPDAQWRLIFTLCRYGGLRCPSEVLRLTWGDVDFDKMRLTIHSSKTEHHEGGGVRLVPIFPELEKHLLDVYGQAPTGSEYIITRYRQANANLRTQLERIILRAGLVPWPKLFQNLRSSRETELCERWPEHVACAWIGNTQTVARKHYLQVTEEHFERAVRRGTESGTRAAQNAAQQPAAPSGRVSQLDGVTAANPLQSQEYCDTLRNGANPRGSSNLHSICPTGLEPAASCSGGKRSIH